MARLGLLLAAASPVAALAASPTSSDPQPGQLLEVHCAAAHEVSGAIGRTVPVHTDTDGRLDLIAQIADQLIWVTGPDPLQFSAPVGISGVTAFAAVPRFGDGYGGLVVATGAGLESVQRNLGQPRIFDAIRTPIGDASWDGARSVVVADFDDDGDADVAGLSSDGRTLLRLHQEAGAQFVPAPSVDLGVEVSMLRPVRWAGSVAALAGYLDGANPAVAVFSIDGFVLDSMPVTGGVSDLTAMADAESAGVDTLAILSGVELTVLRPGGVIEAPVALGAIQPTSMSSSDVDGDGRADVLLNSTSADQVVIALGQDRAVTGGQTLVAPTAASSIVIPLGQPGVDMSAQRANPVGADFDRDGDIDVFTLLEPTRSALLQRNAILDETLQKPTIIGADWFLGSVTSLAFLTVVVPPMIDGLQPDLVEVMLSSSDAGAGSSDEETHKLLIEHVVGSVTNGLGADVIQLSFAGDLGPTSTLLMRGLRVDSATGDVSAVGAEMSYKLVRTSGSNFRGTDGGVDPIPGSGGPQGTPPPPPPGGPIDLFN